MSKIGSGLRETRLKKGLALDRIADDTNIGVRFLTKIENDDFTGFPGEPYVIGFIRNYAEYLGLDAESVLATYRAKDTEKPKPESELRSAESSPAAEQSQAAEPTQRVEPSPEPEAPAKTAAGGKIAKRARSLLPGALSSSGRRSPGVIVAAILAALLIFIVVVWALFGGNGSGKPDAAQGQPMEYRVESGPFDKRMYPGDSLLVPLGNDVYKIRLTEIDESVRLETPFGPYAISLGGTGIIDSDGDGEPEISLIVSDFQKNKPKSGALLRVEYSPAKSETNQAGEIMVSASPAQGAGETADILVTKSSRGPYPFVLQATFRGNCLFRYETDRKDWVEKYYSKGETITINVNSSVTVWASNAQAAKLTFQASGGKSVDIELGAPGEISVKRFAWSNASGTWALVASELN